jgi:O-antigen/teichoic acid export membrane protein
MIVNRPTSRLSTARNLLRNFSALTLGKAVGDVCTFVLFVVLSRSFGAEGIGQYSFAMAFTGFFVVVAEFGLYSFTIKELGRHGERLGPRYGPIHSLRLVLSALVGAALVGAAALVPVSDGARGAILLLGAYNLLYAIFGGLTAVFIAAGDSRVAGVLELSLRIVIATSGIIAVTMGAGLHRAIAAFPIATALHVGIAYVLVWKVHGRPSVRISWADAKDTLRAASAYAGASALRQMSTRVDVLVLGFMLGEVATGIYNAAYRILVPLLFAPHFLALVMLPVASRLFVESREELTALFHTAVRAIVLVGVPVGAGLWLVRGDLILLIFGEAFIASGPLLGILAWLLTLGFLKSLLGVFLMAVDRTRDWTASLGLAAVLNLVGNVMLIHWVGVAGAALATLLSEVAMTVFAAHRLARVIGRPPLGEPLLMSLAGTIAFVVPCVLLGLPLVASVIVGIVVYPAALLLFPRFRTSELPLLRELIATYRPGRGHRGGATS